MCSSDLGETPVSWSFLGAASGGAGVSPWHRRRARAPRRLLQPVLRAPVSRPSAGLLPDAHALTRLCFVVRHLAGAVMDRQVRPLLQPSSLRSGRRRVSTSSCGVLVSSALLSCRLLRILLLAMCRSLLPQQAPCCTSTSSNSAPAGARRFPRIWPYYSSAPGKPMACARRAPFLP